MKLFTKSNQRGFGHVELVLAIAFIAVFAFVGIRVLHQSSAMVDPGTGGTTAPGVRTPPKDIPVPADYNGDGKADLAVFNNGSGLWKISTTLTSTIATSATWGTAGDIPVPADYNGDGKADLAVFRPSNGTWYVKGMTAIAYGTNGDVPVPGDYDGDGKADLALWRQSNGIWYVRGIKNVTTFQNTFNGAYSLQPVAVPPTSYKRSTITNAGPQLAYALLAYQDGSTNLSSYAYTPDVKMYGSFGVNFGQVGDKVVPFMYNLTSPSGTISQGSIAYWRPSNGTWYVSKFGNNTIQQSSVWGVATDIPVAADYNNDGAYEYAVWRPSTATWYLKGIKNIVFGTPYTP